jgi:hypothetical protein
VDRARQLTERRQHLFVGKVGVAAARVRQHEDPRAVHGRVLESRLDLELSRVAENLRERAIHRHADERDHLRPEPVDLLFQNLPALDVFLRLQRVDAGSRARDQVRHADAPQRQPHVVVVRDRLRDDARFVEQPPETIRGAREVMAGNGRHDAGVDADQQQADTGLDAVGKPQMRVVQRA